MRWFRHLRAFVHAETYPRRLIVEAAFELVRARMLTRGSARSFTKELGTLLLEERSPGPMAEPKNAEAVRLGALVSAVGSAAPFRARCLQQSIALRQMLSRRGIPAVVHLGIARDRAQRAGTDDAAHAWVSVGARVVSGGGALENYATVARFG